MSILNLISFNLLLIILHVLEISSFIRTQSYYSKNINNNRFATLYNTDHNNYIRTSKKPISLNILKCKAEPEDIDEAYSQESIESDTQVDLNSTSTLDEQQTPIEEDPTVLATRAAEKQLELELKVKIL